MINYFIPFEKIGEFEIEADLSKYIDNFNFEYTPPDDSTGWETYSISDEGISLYIEKGVIVAIVCEKECLYKGRNIIGMSIEEFIAFSDLEPEAEIDESHLDDDTIQQIFEFNDIGLQVWSENQTIVSVIAGRYIDD